MHLVGSRNEQSTVITLSSPYNHNWLHIYNNYFTVITDMEYLG